MFGNNNFDFNFLFGNNNFTSPNQDICNNNIHNPKLKHTQTDTNKTSSSNKNANLTGDMINSGIDKNNSSPNSIDKTIIRTDAGIDNQKNNNSINSLADGLNSLADTGSTCPVKPDNNKSDISQKTKELVTLQSRLAAKVTGAETNSKKDENLLPPEGSKPVPVKPNTATARDDNQGFSLQIEKSKITRMYPDTSTPRKIITPTPPPPQQQITPPIAQPLPTPNPSTYQIISKDPGNESIKYDGIKDSFKVGDREKLIKDRAEKIYEKIKQYLPNGQTPKENKDAIVDVLHHTSNPVSISEQINKNNKKANLSVTQGSDYFLGSKDKIDNLLQDNHPEKILGNGIGLIGKHTVPTGNNLLTSYHENNSENDRKIVYNFTANNNNTGIIFKRANFEVENSGVKAGAKAVGKDFINGNGKDSLNNAYFKSSDGKVFNIKESNKKLDNLKKEYGKIDHNSEKGKNIKKEIDELQLLKNKITMEKDGRVTVNLNKGETFSFEADKTMKNNQTFASAIEFKNNNDIGVDIRSIPPENATKYQRLGNIGSLPTNEGGLYNTWDKEEIKNKATEIQNKIKKEENNIKEAKTIKEKIEAYLKKTDFEASLSSNNDQQPKADKHENKQVSGVFKNPNYNVTGAIAAVEKTGVVQITEETIQSINGKVDIDKLKNLMNKSGTKDILGKELGKLGFGEKEIQLILNHAGKTGEIITIPPGGYEAKSKEGKTNKGAFSQNFHYKLEIKNYKKGEAYKVVLVPAGGDISSYGQSAPNIASPGNTDKTAISIPSNLVKEGEKYYIEFDYFVVGGSTNPSYAKILEK